MFSVFLVILILTALVCYFAKSWKRKEFDKAERRTAQNLQKKN